jgi:hypothetical protein
MPEDQPGSRFVFDGKQIEVFAKAAMITTECFLLAASVL